MKNATGLTLARVDYSVAGSGNVSRSLDRNAELQLSLNKKDYNPGEEIEISIRAPYVGAGLITIERDHVFAHKWFRSTGTASVQKIALPKDFEGNGYVSVQFARDIGSDEIYMSPMSYGIVPFATSLARRSNRITLQAPALVKPGQPVKIRLESKTPSRAIVFAVDEGILQVARYVAPDPLKFFFQKKALEVTTQQTLDLILPEFKKLMSGAAPGGDAEGLLGKNLNPFKRKTDKPVVYWSGVVEVAGTREFVFTPPESFNGSLRIMAVVINDASAASAVTATTVRGDLVLLPNVPVAITPGAEVEIGLGVANNANGSGKDAPVALALSVSPGLEVLGPATQSLKISERSEVSTTFLVRAKAGAQAQLGSASVIFTAQTGSSKARLSTDVSVRPASAYVTLVQTGSFKGSGEIKAQGDMYANFKRSEAAISASPWAFTSGLIQYLDVYPNGCTEQITSQVFPAVVIGTQPVLAKELLKGHKTGNGTELPDPKKTPERYLALVRARQGADGGFSMWPGGSSDLFATTYVASLLIEAKERKLPVPNDMLQRANAYMQAQLTKTSSQSTVWRSQAFAAYLLTRQGIVATAALTNLREVLRAGIATPHPGGDYKAYDLGAIYLAASYQMSKQDALARELLEPALAHARGKKDDRGNWYWYYYYDPLIQSATLATIVARYFPARIKDLPRDYWDDMARVIGDGYYQSHSAAMVMLAVDAYATAAAQSASGRVSVSAIDAKGLATALTLPREFLLASLPLPRSTAKIKLSNEGDLPLFYSWAESGYERSLPSTAKSQGLEIIHEFLDAGGKVITEAQLGQEVTVRVRSLSVPEALNLAVIPQNPRKRLADASEPFAARAGRGARHRLAARWVARHPEDARFADPAVLNLPFQSRASLPFAAPHAVDYLLRGGAGSELHATLDIKMQVLLERVLADYVKSRSSAGIGNASALLVDASSMQVKAMVGSADYRNVAIDGQVNGVFAKRSPGSTLKPFIYGLALDQGLIHSATVLKDAPSNFGAFAPENFDGRFSGPIPAQQALIRSRNIPAVDLASRLSKPNLYDFLKMSGVQRLAPESHYGLALALGGAEVTMEELAQMYAMLANQGLWHPLRYLAGQGGPADKPLALLSPEAAFIVQDMLRQSPRPDTFAPARPAVAWKTGTSWGFRDAWTAGVFGRFVLVVWVGNFDGSSNPSLVGIEAAAPLFFRIVDALRAEKLDPGPMAAVQPGNLKRIDVCAASGDLPNADCPVTAPAWFIAGKSPIRLSTLHRAV